MAQAKPVAKFKAGPVSAAVWENDIRVGNVTKSVLKCTVERRYKASDDTWKSTGSYGRNEIPLVIHCLQQAFAHIVEDDNAKRSETSTDEEAVV